MKRRLYIYIYLVLYSILFINRSRYRTSSNCYKNYLSILRIENEQDESFFFLFFFSSFEKYINWNRSIVKYRNIYVYIYISKNSKYSFSLYRIHSSKRIHFVTRVRCAFFPPPFFHYIIVHVFSTITNAKKKKKRKLLTKRRSRRSRRARRLFLTNSYMPGGQTWEHTKNTWSMRMIGWIMIVDLCTRSQLFTINKSLINILLD